MMYGNKKYPMMAVVAFLRAILLFSASAGYAVLLATVTILSFVLFSNPVLYAHTFSENEDALFLTLIDKIRAETQLVHDFLNNTQQAQQHAKSAAALLAQNDPVVNTTWTSEISERNPRVVADLLHSLNDLRITISAASPNSSSVQSKVTNIRNLLDEAVSARISKDFLDNPKAQALVLANLGNEIYTHYGNALGLSSNMVASMGGMGMSGKESSKNMNTSSSGLGVMNQSNPPIKNVTAYETSQSLASMAQQIFSKDLKPIAPANETVSTANIEKYIDQLKNAVNNKASFMNIMNLVHVKLHPTMIATYNLTLGR